MITLWDWKSARALLITLDTVLFSNQLNVTPARFLLQEKINMLSSGCFRIFLTHQSDPKILLDRTKSCLYNFFICVGTVSVFIGALTSLSIFFVMARQMQTSTISKTIHHRVDTYFRYSLFTVRFCFQRRFLINILFWKAVWFK